MGIREWIMDNSCSIEQELSIIIEPLIRPISGGSFNNHRYWLARKLVRLRELFRRVWNLNFYLGRRGEGKKKVFPP